MPQNQDRKQSDFSQYDALSTEELSEILRLDSETPEGNGLDIDTLLYITGVLAERKATANTGKTAQEAWKSFQQNYLDSEETVVTEEKTPVKTKNPWIRRMIAAAAVLVLLVSVPLTAKALDWEDICTAVVQWAKETFSFIMGGQQYGDGPNAENTRQYQSLQDALEQAGLPFDMVPTWIPEGYMLDRIDIDRTPVQKSYTAVYKRDNTLLTIGVCTYQQADPQKLEANENIIDTITKDNNDYFILSNNGLNSALWLQDSYECFISGDLTVDEIKEMINSIPEG